MTYELDDPVLERGETIRSTPDGNVTLRLSRDAKINCRRGVPAVFNKQRVGRVVSAHVGLDGLRIKLAIGDNHERLCQAAERGRLGTQVRLEVVKYRKDGRGGKIITECNVKAVPVMVMRMSK